VDKHDDLILNIHSQKCRPALQSYARCIRSYAACIQL